MDAANYRAKANELLAEMETTPPPAGGAPPQVALEFINARVRGRIVVDLARMGFIDSTGLGVLVGALKRARDGGGDLLLATPTSMTTKVLDITGMCRVFEVVDLPSPSPTPA